MKRLLLPLLAAIALPTAVNAFPFGNDVTTKNNVGEKILVKGSTINVKQQYADDLKNNILETIKVFKGNLNKKKEYLPDLENKLGTEKQALKMWEKGYTDMESSEASRDMYKPYFQKSAEAVSYYENKILEVKKSIQEYRGIINSAKNDLLVLKESRNVIHKNQIYFKPILIDLNGQKAVQLEISMPCLNPKLDSKLVGLWNKYSSTKEEYIQLKNLNKKICDKYSKF